MIRLVDLNAYRKYCTDKRALSCVQWVKPGESVLLGK